MIKGIILGLSLLTLSACSNKMDQTTIDTMTEWHSADLVCLDRGLFTSTAVFSQEGKYAVMIVNDGLFSKNTLAREIPEDRVDGFCNDQY